MQLFFSVLIGYLLGSISFSYLIGKLGRKKIDIRKHGSGNAGATNTLRVLGLGPALAVLALDIGKGIAAVWIGKALSDGDLWIPAAAGLSCIAGHNWPVFLRFRGGKGIAATIGVLATLSFFPALYAGLIAIAAVAALRYVSLGSLIFTSLTPVSLLLTDSPVEYVITSLVILVFAVVRHRTNIAKLLRGEEHKLTFRGKTREG